MPAKFITREMSGWGRHPTETCHLMRPEKYHDLLRFSDMTATNTAHLLARGQGRSYGDAALNGGQTLVLTERLNRFLNFDKTKGILTAEAGVTLAEILNIIVPAGWFLPVTPGTQYASLGGAVAADVHGKNHHHSGSIASYILALEIITARQEKIVCTPKDHAPLFWATIGGMGLTGIIGTVVLKLMPVSSEYLEAQHHKACDLEQAFFYLTDKNYDDEYTVAWIDCLKRGKAMGRSVVMRAHHLAQEELPENFRPKHISGKQNKQKNMPFDLPGFILNPFSIKLFNHYYYEYEGKKTAPFITHYENYFYPLDKILNWNRLYGKKGFVQYQCALPADEAFVGIKKLLEILTAHKAASFLAVLKRFGEKSNGLLSFPIPGFTLALDIPFRDAATLHLIRHLTDTVLLHHGRVYLAKDACLSPADFRAMYPEYPEWLEIKKTYDPENIFSSSLSRRLEIGQ